MHARPFAAALALVAVLAAAGCARIEGAVDAALAPAEPTETATAFASDFTTDGSVLLTSDVADALEVRLEAWAVDSKRTSEWTPAAANTFGLAVNVADYRAEERAVLADKRRVYLADIAIASTLAPSGAAGPLAFQADPRTLVPADTTRSDRGLLLNSYQGGLLLPETALGAVPADTTGVTLEVTLTLAIEGAADGGDFQTVTLDQEIPIAIFPAG
ncbi:fructose 1,6-bisphosphatase [Microbacterium sp. ZXX196]|uniref:fructose 1,6-bisphosphatase n=1 Tax=Microbacterium sp. ZXX196 TaxID=2609291 RepID=UPI0012B93292|nr:fructose 1,6-bisphosphatase [Microbacterium sp. ZXX196]MTE24526.1 fructose 1,6-bisphosphatase [Microbacterium sp. ZXX196]